MATISPSPAYNTEFTAKAGEFVSIASGVGRICAPNASPYTFTGTNTYLLGLDEIIVVDPGPDDAAHLAAIMGACGTKKLRAVVLTHTHKDHSSLALKLKAQTDAPVWFAGQHRLSRPKKFGEINPLKNACDWRLIPDQILRDGERINLKGLSIEVIATPGHCANHIALGLTGTPYILTGDHIMGWNSTLIATPDGSVKDYLHSLDRIIASPWTNYLPAHGGAIMAGRDYARQLKSHRLSRNEQILAALQKRPSNVPKLAQKIYPHLSGAVLRAAQMTLLAQLEYLADKEHITLKRNLFGWTATRT